LIFALIIKTDTLTKSNPLQISREYASLSNWREPVPKIGRLRERFKRGRGIKGVRLLQFNYSKTRISFFFNKASHPKQTAPNLKRVRFPLQLERD